jgi:hypothetical protein
MAVEMKMMAVEAVEAEAAEMRTEMRTTVET